MRKCLLNDNLKFVILCSGEREDVPFQNVNFATLFIGLMGSIANNQAGKLRCLFAYFDSVTTDGKQQGIFTRAKKPHHLSACPYGAQTCRVSVCVF